jgi:hypothetical protein
VVKAEVTVWELAERCEASIAAVVHQLVRLGIWNGDAKVEREIADTVCSLLTNPQDRTQRRPEVETVTDARVARAVLDAGAVESAVTRSLIAARSGTSPDLIVPVLDRLVASGLIQTDEDNRITVAPSDARALTAIADQQVVLDDVAT